MMAILFSLLGLLIGLAIGWWWRGQRIGGQKSFNQGPDIQQTLRDNRQELSLTLKNSTDSINKQFYSLQSILTKHFGDLRQDNNRQLEQMRQTVDEKLQSTLEKRLTESFKRVDQQLQAVNQNMGELSNLTDNVTQLQKTLAGVKTRGDWGEAQLKNLLAEVLNAKQYEINFKPNPNSDEKVEFALKIPGEDGQVVYLPIDAKFPLTPFEDLQEAVHLNEVKQINKARSKLLSEIKTQAKKISTKYIHPPLTTDFAVMYLPIESLYAEISQQTQTVDELRRSYKITLAGPSTILPMLALLNMGYRSLAIQKHVSEIQDILIQTEVEFQKFGGLIEKAQKKLNEAHDTLDLAGRKTRSIENKFKKVQKIKDGDLTPINLKSTSS